MDFGRSFPLDPLPSGWHHRKFWTRSPMTMAFAVKDGVPSMRFETRASASMLFREVDIDLAAYPMLAWRWFIELPIKSPLDERTREGDDHPARLFLRFITDRREKCAMEVIWGNRLKPGDYKYIHLRRDTGLKFPRAERCNPARSLPARGRAGVRAKLRSSYQSRQALLYAAFASLE
jgi:hypothetical protein